MSDDKSQTPEKTPDELCYERLKEIYESVKKAIELNRQPKDELKEAIKVFGEVLEDDEFFKDKPKAAQFFYGDFVNGACRRLLLEGPIDDGEYMEVIKSVFIHIIKLLRREIDHDNSDLVDSVRVLFDPNMRLYKFQFLTPEENRKYQQQLLERKRQEDAWRGSLQVNDLVDCVKVDKRVGDVKGWDLGRVQVVRGDYFAITFVNDHSRFDRYLSKTSDEIAPAGTKSDDYKWRGELKSGDNIDVIDPLGTWYNSTILEILEEIEAATSSSPEKKYPVLLVGYRVYCEDGKKVDEDGRHFAGWSSKYDERIALYSPRIAKFNSKTKYLGRGQSIYDFQKVDDDLDMQTAEDADGGKNYVMPRKYYSSSALFMSLFNTFGQLGGFDRILARVEDTEEKTSLPFEMVFYYTEMMTKLAPMFHKQVAQQFLPNFSHAVENNLQKSSPANMRNMEPERFDSIVPDLEKMLTRVIPSQQANLEVDLFNLNMCLTMLRSDFFPRRIQGFKNLNEITKQLRFYVSRSFKADYLAKWLKDNEILKEVFSQERHHLQLIQRAGDVIKFLLLESEITPDELKLIWNATTFDEDVKMEVLKLVKEIAMQLPLNLCNEITDLIISTESSETTGAVADKVMDELLDALHEIARFAMHKYDYTAKITMHLKKIAEDPNTSPERADVALDRYSDLLRVWPMEPDRENVLKQCVADIAAHKQPLSSMKIIKNILENLMPTGKSEMDKYERSECIDFLIQKTDLFKHFFQDFEYYCKAVEDEIRNNLGMYYSDKKEDSNKEFPSPNDLKLFDRYPHSEHIKQRLDFLYYILIQSPSLRITKSQLQLLWEILVVRSIILADKEAMYRWLKRTSNEQNQEITFMELEDMRGFFSETMCSSENKYKQLSVEGFECIKSFFLIVNESNQRLQRFAEKAARTNNHVETSAGYTSIGSDGFTASKAYSFTRRMGITDHEDDDDSGDIEFKIRTLPSELEGTKIFWSILLKASSKNVIEHVTDFIIKLHQQVDSTLEDKAPEILQLLIGQCLNLIEKAFKIFQQNKELTQDQENLFVRLLQMMKQLLLESEKTGGNGGVRPHAALLRGDLLKILCNNSVLYKKEIPRKIEFHVYSNTTIWELRYKLSRINNISPDMIRLIKSPAREIKDSDNAKTLAELRISNGDTLIASKRQVQTLPKANLVTVGNEITPAAKAIFLEWFHKYKTDEYAMNPEGLANFTKSCTEDSCSPNDKRILAVIETYDDDKDGKLNETEFLEFYRDSSVKRPKVVWNNILSHGYRRDLKHVDEANDGNVSVDVSLLPRFSISRNAIQFEKIFSLLSLPGKIGKEAWDLVNQLTTNPLLHQQLLGICDAKEIKWEELIDAKTSIYKLLYTLQIMESFLEETKGAQAERVLYVQEEKKKDKEGKEKKVDIRRLITFNPSGQAIFHKDEHGEEEKEQKDDKMPSEQQIQEMALEELKREWRLNFVVKGGLQYLLKLFIQSGEGKNVLRIKDDMDRIEKRCLGFVLRILKLYIISAYCSKDSSAYNMVFERQGSSSIAEIVKEASQEAQATEKSDAETSMGTGFIGPLSQAHYNAMTDTYSITESILFGDGDVSSETVKKVEQKRKEMTSKEGRELVEQLRGNTAGQLLESIDFENLQQRVLNTVILVLSKKSIEMDDTKNIENALNLWLVCMLNKPELIQDFYDFKGQQVLVKEEKGEEVHITRDLDCTGLIKTGLFCHKSTSVREEFEQTIFYLATKISTPQRSTNLKPLSVILGLLLKMMPEELSQEVRECKEYFSLLCELLDMYFLEKEKEGEQLFNAEDLVELAITRLIHHKSSEKRKSIFEDKALIGYLNLTNKLLASIGAAKAQELGKKYNLIEELFQQCLFAPHKDLPEGVELTSTTDVNLEDMTPHKCKTRESRAAAYSLLSTVVKNDPASLETLVHNYLLPLTAKIKVRTGWAYTPSSDSRSFHGYAGLRNLGCICYMLAMIQQFYMVPTFRYGMLKVQDGLPEDIVEYKKRMIDDNVLHQLQKMLGFQELTERQDFNPFDFCFACKDIEGKPTQLGVQQDAQEFLNVIFDRIETALRPTPQKYLLYSVFGGKNCNQCICQNCGNITRRVEDFYNLSLEVRHMKTVYDSLEKYVSGEKIDDFKCEACDQKVTVVKRTCLSELPNVLIVHLQRITLDYDTWENVKINTRLQFPTKLNLKPYMEDSLLKKDEQEKMQQQQEEQQEEGGAAAENAKESEDEPLERKASQKIDEPEAKPEEGKKEEEDEDSQYEFKLVGIVIHVGTAQAGHYYSYINTKRGNKNNEDSPDYMNTEKEKWLEFNDSSVRDFKFSTLENECFGGESKGEQSLESEIFSTFSLRSLGGARENCKNAYMLVYERRRKGPVKLVVPLDREGAAGSRESEEKVHFDEDKQEHFVLQPFNSVERYVPHHIYKQVWDDNNEFLFEKQIYANEFFSFLRDVLLTVKDTITQQSVDSNLRANLSQDMVTVGSKMVLQVLSRAYSNDPISKITDALYEIYQNSEDASRQFLQELLKDEGTPFLKLMFNCPDKTVRACVSKLAAACLNTIFDKEIEILQEKEEIFDEDQKSLGVFPKALSVRFFDFMEGLVRSECQKHWTKFQQFFNIFRDFAYGGHNQRVFLMSREIIATLVDFMLANSSPLKQPHEKRALMGSRYMVPYFDSLVETVCFLSRYAYTDSFYPKLEVGKDQEGNPIYDEQLQPSAAFLGEDPTKCFLLSQNESICLRCVQFLEKSLKDAHAPKALASYVQHWAYNDYNFSIQTAKVILNGINETDYQEIVPYLSCISEFLCINDRFTQQRLEWLLGLSLPSTGRLAVELSRFGLTIADSITDDVTNYYSPITFDNTNESVLTLLWRYHNRWDTYTMRCLNCLLWLMNESEAVFDWLFNAAPATYQHSRYSDWFAAFINNYLADFKKYQGAYSTKREEMAQESLKIWLELETKINKRLEESKGLFKGELPPPIKVFLNSDIDGEDVKQGEEVELQHLDRFPPNYIIGDTIEEKILWKRSQDGIDIRVYEVFTEVFWSRPTGVENLTFNTLYFKVKKNRKEEERRVLFENKKTVHESISGPKPHKTTPLPEQKEETGMEPITGVDSDGNDSTAARDGSDDETPQVNPHLGEVDNASMSSGENINKITASESAGPKTVVVNEQAGQAAEDASTAAAQILDEKMFLNEKPRIVSSVLKVTITNTREKQALVSMQFQPKKGTPTNFYLPETPFNMKIKEATLRSIAFFQKEDITAPWGDFDVYLHVSDMEVHGIGGGRHIGPQIGSSLQHTGHNQFQIEFSGVGGDQNIEDLYDTNADTSLGRQNSSDESGSIDYEGVD